MPPEAKNVRNQNVSEIVCDTARTPWEWAQGARRRERRRRVVWQNVRGCRKARPAL